MVPLRQPLQSSGRSPAGDLPAVVFWTGSASPRKPLSLLFEINARVIAALCSFVVCLSDCLCQKSGKIPEEKLLTNRAAISFFLTLTAASVK